MPKDVIINEDERTNKNAYYIYNGICMVYHKKSGIDLKALSKKEFFGEYAFFTNRDRTASVRSEDFSEIVTIEKKKFLQVLSKSQSSDREKFYKIRDEI